MDDQMNDSAHEDSILANRNANKSNVIRQLAVALAMALSAILVSLLWTSDLARSCAVGLGVFVLAFCTARFGPW